MKITTIRYMMKKCFNVFLCVPIVISVFTACNQKYNLQQHRSLEEKHSNINFHKENMPILPVENTDTSDSDGIVEYAHIFDIMIPIYEFLNMDLGDISSSCFLNEEENKQVKNAVIDTMLYIFGFDIEFNDLPLAIEESRELFANMPWVDDGWTIADEIIMHYENNSRGKTILTHVSINFMDWAGWQSSTYPFGEAERHIFWVIFTVFTDDPRRPTYNIFLKDIEGTYKIVNLIAE